MNFERAIQNFPKQFLWKPKIVNAGKLKRASHYIVAGMGGSGLSANLISSWRPSFPLTIHNTYGLPQLPNTTLKKSLFIASSYSGNTEEVTSALNKALKNKIPSAVVATGGKLISMAKKHSLPYILLPDTGIQPRSATGFSVIALLKLMGEKEGIKELEKLSSTLNVANAKKDGKKLAGEIRGKIPIVYSSFDNNAIAYNWKIRFNESGKIPAFSNVFPELNHNEMMGFDYPRLSKLFHAIFLSDKNDHPRIIKRMKLTASILKKGGLPVTLMPLRGKSFWKKAFSSLMIADWASYYTALKNGCDPGNEKTIETFKRLL